MSAGGDGRPLASISLVHLRSAQAAHVREAGELSESGEEKDAKEQGTASGAEQSKAASPVFARVDDDDDDAIAPLLPWEDASSDATRPDSAPSTFPRVSSSNTSHLSIWQRLLHGIRHLRVLVQVQPPFPLGTPFSLSSSLMLTSHL